MSSYLMNTLRSLAVRRVSRSTQSLVSTATRYHTISPQHTGSLSCCTIRPAQCVAGSFQSRTFSLSTRSFNEHIFNIQDEADFQERVTKNNVPVIVDFHATWCGPCKLLGPRLESLVASKKGKVVLAKVDIDEMTEIAMNHKVEAVPTVIGMKNGKVMDKFVGLKDDADLESFVEKLVQ